MGLLGLSLISLLLVLGGLLGNSAGQEPATAPDVYWKTEGPISGPPAPELTADDYPKLPLPGVLGESRVIVWFAAQQHLYFGGFVLGALFLVMLFEIAGLVVRKQESSERFDRVAYSTLQLTVLVFSVAALLGGLLLFVLLALYPTLTGYLGNVFRASFLIYGLIFLLLSGSVYLYFLTWQRMEASGPKWMHATIGLIVNGLGLVILMISTSWSTFMLSPAGVDGAGRFLGNHWLVLHNALWNPMNVHRFLGNIVFAAAALGAYAAYRALTAKTQDDRAYHDWMGGVMLLVMVLALFTIPFGGYWLQREIFGYRQYMGITLSGGLPISSIGFVASLMSLIFLAINYYLWQWINRRKDGDRYRSQIKYVFFVLAVAMVIFITPSTIILTLEELKAMGAQDHPVVGNSGTMSAKQAAVNIILLVTGRSLLMVWRSRYDFAGRHVSTIDAIMMGFFLAGAINIIWLGIYGY